MKRKAGAVERFFCGSAGRLEVSKCRAVLGTAFAGARFDCCRQSIVGYLNINGLSLHGSCCRLSAN